MYHKTRNTLMSLAIASMALASVALLGEPVSATAPPATATPSDESTQVEFAQLDTDIPEVEATTSEHRADRARTSSRLRLELGMPYYSFGAVLPRHAGS